MEESVEMFRNRMVGVLEAMGVVVKDAKNEFHNYSYATAASAISKFQEGLVAQGLYLKSTAELVSFQNGLAIVKVRLTVTDGAFETSMEGLGAGTDKGDKAIMKANTAALKYALASGLALAWVDEDPEHDSVDEWVDGIAECKNASELAVIREKLNKMSSQKRFKASDVNKIKKALTQKLQVFEKEKEDGK